jgi:hypothetical protein
MISLQELTAKRERLATLLGPLRPDGFAEFSQLIENANKVCSTDPDEAEKLRRRAEKIEAQVESSAKTALALREQVRSKLLQFAEEGMDRYDKALEELSK